MAVTIDIESKLQSRLLVDIDKYRLKYVTREKDELSGTDLTIQFASPYIKVYEHFKFFLLKNSVRKKLSPKNFYRPDYVSYEEYGNVSLWNLLLFINDISNIENFDVDEIYVPTKTAVTVLTNNIVAANIPIDLDMPTFPLADANAKLYEDKQSPTLQNVTDNTITPPAGQDYYFVTQTFPIRTIVVSQKYVDLRYAAVADSLVFKVKNQPTFIYGTHYVLVSHDGQMSRVTWSKQYTEIGLEDVITEGDIVEVKYAREI